jgi:hypothetical protein
MPLQTILVALALFVVYAVLSQMFALDMWSFARRRTSLAGVEGVE